MLIQLVFQIGFVFNSFVDPDPYNISTRYIEKKLVTDWQKFTVLI